MKAERKPQRSSRARVVHFIWRNLPRFVLVGMIIFIIILLKAILAESEVNRVEKENALAQKKPLINTVSLTIKPSIMLDKINLPGEIEPWTRLNLMAKVGGSITEVLVQEGDVVEEGAILAKIEDNDYKIALDRAQAAYTLAKANFKRDKRVHAKGAIPTAELEAKETSMQTAKADLENAKLLLSRCIITAPMTGVVNRLDAEVGLFMSVGDPVGELLKIDQVKAVIGIPESDISSVRKLDTVDITIKALGDRVVTGKKFFISSAPDSLARSYRMELALDNENGDILPGMFIRAKVVKQRVEDGVAVPFYSVITRNNEQYVFIEKDGVVQKQPVKLGIMENWLVQITSGVKPGDNVIIEGQRDIESGQKVKVVKTITDPGNYTL